MRIQKIETSEKILESNEFLLYRGINSETKEIVLVKIAEVTSAIFKLKNEIDVLNNYNIESAPEIIESNLNTANPYTIYKNIPGVILTNLIEIINNGPFDKICDTFICLATSLQKIHKQNVIHNGVLPSNILYDNTKNSCAFIDFGSASEFDFKIRDQILTNVHTANLRYIAPEQTGRINRSIDQRSDLYSLGIIFYELLTGNTPFNSADPIELIHFHISRIPEPLKSKSFELDKIIHKLISKNPENRYQSTYGLLYDLKRVKSGETNFEIASKDYSSRLQLNETLYGRTNEKDLIYSLLEDTSNNRSKTNFLILFGGAGQGKSSLIEEILNETILKKGYFLRGKHDQILQNIPYSSLSQILKKYVEVLLSQKTEIQNDTKEKLRLGLEDNAGIITLLVPEMELLLGKQPVPFALEGQEALNRFNSIILILFKLMASIAKPLVIVFDDIQWADLATIKLINNILLEKYIPGLFIILSSRVKSELTAIHFKTFLDQVENLSYLNIIELYDLKKIHTKNLLKDAIGESAEEFESLVDFLFTTTNGNPFFTKELLKELIIHKALYFDYSKESWCFNKSIIQNISIGETILDFIEFRLKSLSTDTLSFLKLASCEGLTFDLHSFTNFENFTIDSLLLFAKEATKAGIIFPKGNSKDNTCYSFLHDRILQTTYQLITPNEKIKFNFHLAEYYKKNFPDSKIIDICNFYTQAIELLVDKTQIEELIHLHYKAILYAKKNIAYDLGLSLANTALTFLRQIDSKDEELEFSIREEYGWFLFATGNFEEGEKVYLELIDKCKNLRVYSRLNIIRMGSLASRSRIFDSVNLGLEVLHKLGVHIPESEEERGAMFLSEYGKILHFLETHKPNDLVKLNRMDDEIQIIIQQILSRLLIPTILSAQLTLLGILTCISITLVIENGATDLVAYAYALFAVTIINIKQDYKTGVEFGEIAIEVSQWNHNKALMGGVFNTVGCITNHLKYPAIDNERLFQLSSKYCEESGNIFEMVLSEGNSLWNHFYRGDNIHDVYNKIAHFETICQKYNVWDAMLNIYYPTMAMLKFLVAEHDVSEPLIYSGRTEKSHVEIVESLGSKSPLAQFYGILITKSFLFGRYEEILETGELLEKNTAAPTVYHDICPNFYRCVAYILVLHTLTDDKKVFYQGKIDKLKTDFYNFSELNPNNFQHMYSLILAVASWAKNEKWEAMKYFDDSITSALDNGYIQNAALAFEIAGNFYIENERQIIATNYYLEAYKLYNIWGAVAKIKDMDLKYPNLKSQAQNIQKQDKENSLNLKKSNTDLQMDYISMMKAANILLREVRIDKLIEKIIQVILENSGANEATLIIKQNEKFMVHTYGTISDAIHIESINEPIEKFKNLSPNIVNYVLHSKNHVILDNASKHKEYLNNPYLSNKKVQSLLCKPITHKGEVIGAIYLENNFISGAFSNERAEVINLISTLAGISLENSILYEELDSKVKARTSELHKTNTKLIETNSLLNETLENLKSTQDQLILSEKMVVLGKLISGIAHEINTPLAAIVASNQLTYDLLSENSLTLLETYSQLGKKEKEAWKTLFEIRKNNQIFISSTISRKIKQELNAIFLENGFETSNYTTDTLIELGVNKSNVSQLFPFLNLDGFDTVLENLLNLSTILNSGSIIKNAAMRATKVIKALKNYVYENQNEYLSEINIGDQIEMCLVLYQNRVKSSMEIITDFKEETKIIGYADLLNQVWINLINNALYAVKFSGRLVIRTYIEDTYLAVSFQDNGEGIPEVYQSKIFNPFFTTKSAEDGSGLGLDICKKIIERHNGKIEFTSKPGNTCFTVYLNRFLKIKDFPFPKE